MSRGVEKSWKEAIVRDQLLNSEEAEAKIKAVGLIEIKEIVILVISIEY